MSAIAGLESVSGIAANPVIMQLGGAVLSQQPVQGAGFGDILAAGMKQVEAKLSSADSLVRQFALDDSIPVHQVTFALEEARMSVELAMQVRARLVESYRDMMNMQI
ncbi:flagellar hook-basal body complex protein FliE [Sphingomonas sp. So64.6b]|uniref:flagellar hook-basal body complex protein FliE n=1 Tax=Sphingomonas sp. So64.6b TaxID=2997354 RepID=UPI0015FFD891|nr:flagellar hook-basal body complex protein FliE [Sphingomonas sp. So64.6b]QNA82927.1 flagellar hook-basal body complex protein FliE [Sphingomonas sp. So64.6b]